MTLTLLNTSHAQYVLMVEAAQKRGKVARVSMPALQNLLIDHSVMVRALRDAGGRVDEPC